MKSGDSSLSGAVPASKLEAILESAIDAIIAIDSRGLIETVNPATEALFQYQRSELVGRNITCLMPEPYQSAHDTYLRNYFSTGQRKIIGIGREVVGMRKDGTTFPMHLSVGEFEVDGQTYFTGIVHDLSKRERTEHALRQAQKMEAIGQLTGGIAHDFNNLLTVVIGNLELVDMMLSEQKPRDLLRQAQEAAELGSRLTDRLLTFARRQHLSSAHVDLNGSVLGLIDLLRRTLGEPIDLSTVLGPDLWPVWADRSQLESAIVNLAVNARDAMPLGGKLIVETRNVRVDSGYRTAEGDLTPGDYVHLSVTDSGTGMPAEVRDRVFEPFFTTKEAGRGTGLGLSMVYGFAKQSGGHVTIYSEVGQGTVVNIYLPRQIDRESTDVPDSETSPRTTGNGELILVVEDDERVRTLSLARLEQLGFRVLAAENGPQALEMIDQNPDIDLIFTDLVMPGGMSGYELCETVREKHPHIKLLLTSGYSEDLVNAENLAAMGLIVLRKPYRQADLMDSIAAALSR
jgi:PAS domain S-box-containing protein